MTLLEPIAPESCREGSPVPVLETARLVLRAPRLNDAKAIASLINDRRITDNTLRVPYPYGLDDAHTFLASVNQACDEPAFLITDHAGTLLGGCGIGKREGETHEIGYWLGVASWSRGYATEAARAVIDYAFVELGLDTLAAGARVSNPASRRVLEKCGFQWTGVGLYRIRSLRSSAPCDRFRLDRGLWASLKSWGGNGG